MLRIVRLASATVFGVAVGVLQPPSALPLLPGPGSVSASTTAESFRWQGRIAPGQSVEIKGVNGGIVAEPGSGDTVEVTAEKSGRRNNPADVRIEVVEHAGGITVCAVYPSPDGAPNQCVAGHGGRMRTENNDVKVDFRVRVPVGASLVARTVNGAIEATALDGKVEAHTVNGAVKVRTRGQAEAQTVNGSIDADLGDASWEGTLQFQTVNGSIEIGLPESTGAQVFAETVNGELQSDFPVTMTGRFGPKRFEGTIGGGGRELRLKTVNGRIALRRAGG